jgi:hypothetical protein
VRQLLFRLDEAHDTQLRTEVKDQKVGATDFLVKFVIENSLTGRIGWSIIRSLHGKQHPW